MSVQRYRLTLETNDYTLVSGLHDVAVCCPGVDVAYELINDDCPRHGMALTSEVAERRGGVSESLFACRYPGGPGCVNATPEGACCCVMVTDG